VDAKQFVRESAQIPTFLGLSAAAIQGTVLANVDVSLAPVSTVGITSAGPVPRYVAVEPLSDCDAVGDCNAAYFPHLVVGGPALTYAAAPGAFLQTKYEILYNTGSGEMPWTATTTIERAEMVYLAILRLHRETPASTLIGLVRRGLHVDGGHRLDHRGQPQFAGDVHGGDPSPR
jgi:hypothetical protein